MKKKATFATGVVAHEGRAIMAGAEKKKRNKKAHLERKRSKGRHKLKEVI